MVCIKKTTRVHCTLLDECVINGGTETEVTVTSKRHAQAERAKKEKREEKAAVIGGAGRDP